MVMASSSLIWFFFLVLLVSTLAAVEEASPESTDEPPLAKAEDVETMSTSTSTLRPSSPPTPPQKTSLTPIEFPKDFHKMDEHRSTSLIVIKDGPLSDYDGWLIQAVNELNDQFDGKLYNCFEMICDAKKYPTNTWLKEKCELFVSGCE